MNLATRRILNDIKNETLTSQNILQQNTGLNITLTVEESSFPDDEKVLNDFFIHKIYGLTSIIEAVSTIASDNLGREVLTEKVKHIRLFNTATGWNIDGGKKVVLNGDTLEIHISFSENSDNLYKPEPLVMAIEQIL